MKKLIYWILGIIVFIGWAILVWGEQENKMTWMLLTPLALVLVVVLGYWLIFGEDD